MPTVQTMTYFQVASNEVRVNLNATKSADTKVVASIATHIRPRLFTVTTTNIIHTNMWDRA